MKKKKLAKVVRAIIDNPDIATSITNRVDRVIRAHILQIQSIVQQAETRSYREGFEAARKKAIDVGELPHHPPGSPSVR